MPSLKVCKFDNEKEQNGIWFDTPEGWRLKIARVGNSKHKKFIQKIVLNNQRSIKNDKSGDVILNFVKEAASKYILLDWADLLEDDEKTEIPYSSEKALEIFMEYDEFYELVLEYAGQEDKFREDLVSETVKN